MMCFVSISHPELELTVVSFLLGAHSNLAIGTFRSAIFFFFCASFALVICSFFTDNLIYVYRYWNMALISMMAISILKEIAMVVSYLIL